MTTEQQQEITRLYNSGIRVKSIGHLTGIDDNLVKRYIYKIIDIPKRNKTHSSQSINRIKELRLDGHTGKQIECILGLDRSQIRYILMKNNLSYRKIDEKIQSL